MDGFSCDTVACPNTTLQCSESEAQYAGGQSKRPLSVSTFTAICRWVGAGGCRWDGVHRPAGGGLRGPDRRDGGGADWSVSVTGNG